MADFNTNNYAPEQAAAAPEKKTIPTKLIAIAAAAVAAIILLIIIFGNGIPGKVEEEIKDGFEEMGVKVGSLDKEYKVSKDGASFYVISGRIKGTIDEDDDDYDEDMEDYKNGYFIAIAYECDGEVDWTPMGVYEKDDKDDFKDALKEFKEECKDNKDEIKDSLEEIAEEAKD